MADADEELSKWLEDLDRRVQEDAGPVEPDRSLDLKQLPVETRRYAVGPELGRGNVGAIELGEDRVLHRAVAIKRLRSSAPSTEELSRFLLEARVTGALDHPNIINVHDLALDDDGRPYFTMQFVRGERTLAAVIEALRAKDTEVSPRYSYQRRVQIVLALCEAVQYAHERGVIHRDLKPGNVMVGPHGQVLVIDWGLAFVPNLGDGGPADVRELLAGDAPPAIKPFVSEPNVLRGTLGYMAPEQLEGEPASERTDTFALAAILYEVLTLQHHLGQPRGLSDHLTAALRGERAPADDFTDPLHGRVPRALAKVCREGLERDPERRLQTPRELHYALQHWLEGDVPIMCPTTFSMRLLSRWIRLLNDHPKPATYATFLVVLLWALAVVLLAAQLVAR